MIIFSQTITFPDIKEHTQAAGAIQIQVMSSCFVARDSMEWTVYPMLQHDWWYESNPGLFDSEYMYVALLTLHGHNMVSSGEPRLDYKPNLSL